MKDKKPYLFAGSGLVLAVMSAVFFSAQTLLVAKLRELNSMEVTFCRFTVITILTIPILLYCKQSFIGTPEERMNLFIRAVLGCFSMMFLYYSLHNMPLGDATVIYMTSPIFVGVLAFFILKESCGAFEIISTIIMLIAVVFIAQPPFIFGTKALRKGEVVSTGHQRMWASLSGLIGSVFHASVHIALRRLKHTHVATVLFTYSVWGMLQSAAFTYVVDGWSIPKNPSSWGYIFGIGAFAVMALSCLTIALQTENAGSVSVLRSSDLLFAFIWEVLFLNDYPNVYTLIGAGLVLFCVFAYGFRKWYKIRKQSREEKEEDSSDEERPILAPSLEKESETRYQLRKISESDSNDIVTLSEDPINTEAKKWYQFWRKSVQNIVNRKTEEATEEKQPILASSSDGHKGGARKWYQAQKTADNNVDDGKKPEGDINVQPTSEDNDNDSQTSADIVDDRKTSKKNVNGQKSEVGASEENLPNPVP